MCFQPLKAVNFFIIIVETWEAFISAFSTSFSDFALPPFQKLPLRSQDVNPVKLQPVVTDFLSECHTKSAPCSEWQYRACNKMKLYSYHIHLFFQTSSKQNNQILS